MKCRDRLYGVLLVGIEGVGKTRLSKQLARLLGWIAIDADDLVPAGATLEGLRRSNDQEALARRERLVADTILKAPRKKVILATTMRPLKPMLSDPAQRQKLKEHLRKHWIIVEITGDLECVARYFEQNPLAKGQRSRLQGADDYREILRCLRQFRAECEPLYHEFADGFAVAKPENEHLTLVGLLSEIVCVMERLVEGRESNADEANHHERPNQLQPGSAGGCDERANRLPGASIRAGRRASSRNAREITSPLQQRQREK